MTQTGDALVGLRPKRVNKIQNDRDVNKGKMHSSGPCGKLGSTAKWGVQDIMFDQG